MAIANVGSRGTTVSSTSSNTITRAPTATVAAGQVLLAFFSGDNTSASDGDNSEVTSVTDTQGNTWTKAAEYTNSGGSAAAGVTASLWFSNIETQLTTGDVVTMSLSANATDKCMALWEYSVAAGNGIQAVGSPVTNEVNAAQGFGSAVISSLPSKEYLFVRCAGKEANSTTTITASSGFVSYAWNIRSRNNTAAQILRGEYDIVTGTGATSNPTLAVTGDTASVFVAFEEFSPPQDLAPGLFTNDNTFYSPTVSGTTPAQDLLPNRHDNTQSFYAPTVSAGQVTLQPGLLSGSQVFYAPTVAPAAVTLTPARIEGTESFFPADLVALNPAPYVATGYWEYGYAEFDVAPAQTLTAGLFTNTSTFPAATVSPGAVSIAPPRVDGTQTFYPATVTTGAVTLQPARLDGVSTFYGPTVSAGSVTVQPARLENNQTFFGPVVAPGAAVLQPQRLENAQSFYGASISTGAVSVLPGRIESAVQFFGAVVSPGPVVLQPGLLTNSSQFFDPTVANGMAILSPPYFENQQAFYGAQVNLGLRCDEPGAWPFQNASLFFSPTVLAGAVTLSAPFVPNQNVIYEATVSDGQTVASGGYALSRRRRRM